MHTRDPFDIPVKILQRDLPGVDEWQSGRSKTDGYSSIQFQPVMGKRAAMRCPQFENRRSGRIFLRKLRLELQTRRRRQTRQKARGRPDLAWACCRLQKRV